MKNGQSFLGWLQYDARYIPMYTKNGIKNLFRYFKVIWKDNSYGSQTTFELLKRKLELIAKDVAKANHYVDWERDVERMNTVIRLIDKIKDEYYASEYMIDWDINIENYQSYRDSRDYSALFRKYPRIHKYILNNPGAKNTFFYKSDEDDHHSLVMSICQYNQDRAHKLLFKLIEENIYSWGW